MARTVAVESGATLNDVIAAIEAGETVEVTRAGSAVARVLRASAQGDDAMAAIDRIKAHRVGVRLGGTSLEALRDEGRR